MLLFGWSPLSTMGWFERVSAPSPMGHRAPPFFETSERAKIAFASERAGRLFYETLSKLPHEEREESKNEVSLILIHLERKTVTGNNRFFNQAVERCDTDKDGTITEEEAQIFAASA